MTAPEPIYIDATMLYRWRDLAPVGIVRLERLLASHLRFRSQLGPAQYVLWDRGYRPTDDYETSLLDALLDGSSVICTDDQSVDTTSTIITPTAAGNRRGAGAALRRVGLKAVARMPDHLRPFAEQAAWSTATLTVESVRHIRRSRQRRLASVTRSAQTVGVRHQVDFSTGGDLVALGLGWEYLDHEAMYLLRQNYGIRIHMPAFDLIPITMPHMNAGQSDLVHRYYVEMAHYADTITSISKATEHALRLFLADEELPVPHVATNPLPGFDMDTSDQAQAEPKASRHRLRDKPFVLSVSTIEIRKNHVLLAKIWAECAREGIELPHLVLVGRVGWDVDELLRWTHHAPELRDRVSILSDVEDTELVELYRDALFTVFPSRTEGWGLPITESLTYGKVCIHSTDPAQLEASQDLMPALHPDDFVGWKHEVVRMVTDERYRSDLESSITQHYVPRTSDQYCSTFEAILASRRSSGR